MTDFRPWLDLRSRRVWALLLAATTLVGLLEGTQLHIGLGVAGKATKWAPAFGATMPSWYVLLALLPGIVWLVRRFPFDGQSWRRSLIVHSAAAVIFAAVHLSLSSYISDYILQRDLAISFVRNLSRLLAIYFVIELFFYWSIVGAYYVGEYAHRLRDRERLAAQLALKTSRLETSLTRAHLETLRMQLNPHFLFNTLNAISVLALKGEKQSVVRTLTLLSDLLRVSLQSGEQVVALSEEIELLKRYLEIERTRFKDRLAVNIEVDPAVMNAEVPTLLLQPLVENAIRHGISQRAGEGRIDVQARHVSGRLRITVQDTGPGFQHGSANGGTGIGLANTRARLEELYGAEYRFAMGNAPGGGGLVELDLPLLPLGAAVAEPALAPAQA